MMRLFTINTLTVALVLFGASSASAVNVFLGTPSATSINVGETVSIQFRLDTEGATDVTSVFTSIFADPAVLGFSSGASPLNILYNTSNFEALSRVSQPVAVVDPNDPAPVGGVHAANFATPTPTGSGLASANQILASVTFVGVAPGSTVISAAALPGDTITRSTVAVAYTTGPDSALITVVPEPGTALLMGLGLAGLGLAGRRNA
jgi:hypothetical protein